MNRIFAVGAIFAACLSSAQADGAFVDSGFAHVSTGSSASGSDSFWWMLENLGDKVDIRPSINLNAMAPGYDYGQFYGDFSGSIDISLDEISVASGYEIKGFEISFAPTVHFSGNGEVNLMLTANGVQMWSNSWAMGITPVTPSMFAYTGFVGAEKADDFYMSLRFAGSASCPDWSYESCMGGSSANFSLNQVVVKVIAAPVPEPEGLALALAGLVLVGSWFARRNRQI